MITSCKSYIRTVEIDFQNALHDCTLVKKAIDENRISDLCVKVLSTGILVEYKSLSPIKALIKWVGKTSSNMREDQQNVISCIEQRALFDKVYSIYRNYGRKYYAYLINYHDMLPENKITDEITDVHLRLFLDFQQCLDEIRSLSIFPVDDYTSNPNPIVLFNTKKLVRQTLEESAIKISFADFTYLFQSKLNEKAMDKEIVDIIIALLKLPDFSNVFPEQAFYFTNYMNKMNESLPEKLFKAIECFFTIKKPCPPPLPLTLNVEEAFDTMDLQLEMSYINSYK